jgi:hypothetical protein
MWHKRSSDLPLFNRTPSAITTTNPNLGYPRGYRRRKSGRTTSSLLTRWRWRDGGDVPKPKWSFHHQNDTPRNGTPPKDLLCDYNNLIVEITTSKCGKEIFRFFLLLIMMVGLKIRIFQSRRDIQCRQAFPNHTRWYLSNINGWSYSKNSANRILV